MRLALPFAYLPAMYGRLGSRHSLTCNGGCECVWQRRKTVVRPRGQRLGSRRHTAENEKKVGWERKRERERERERERGERERGERERERKTDRQTDRQTEKETDTQTHRHADTQSQEDKRHNETERERVTDRQTEING